MSNILAIESSGQNCSVALLVDGKLLSKEAHGQRSHTEHLLEFIDELFEESGIDKHSLQAVAFSAGPGSFTGIRLASSVAKSFAYALDIAVVPVSTLACAAQHYLQKSNGDVVSVVSDARMGDVYLGCYERTGALVTERESDRMISQSEFSTLQFNQAVITDEKKVFSQEQLEQIEVIEWLELHATTVAKLAAEFFSKGEVSSALEASAIYLRDKTSWKNTEQQKQERKDK